MKRGWLVLSLVVGLAAPAVSHAQVSAFGKFTASKLLNGPQGDFLYGVTTGVLVDGPRVKLSPRWDAVLDYSYAQDGVNNGEYNPKTISIGAFTTS